MMRIIPSGNRNLGWAFLYLSLVLVSVGTFPGPEPIPGGFGSAQAAGIAQQRLSSKAEDQLITLIAGGNLPELRWPDFSDYRVPLTNLYETTSYSLVWVRRNQPTPQVPAIVEVLQQADSKGLSAEDYDSARWAERLARLRQSPSEDELVRFELAFTVTVMRYVSDLHLGKVNPRVFHFGFEVEDKRYELPDYLLEQLVNAPDAKAALEQLDSPIQGYRRVEQALQNYRELARRDDGEPLPIPPKPVRRGGTYLGVPRLARLLRVLGDLPPDAGVPANSRLYDGGLVDAVKRFQSRHGLAPDGRLDAHTLQELNVPLSQRVRQLQLTLERWRWLPHDFRQPPIVVNIPEFRLRAFDEQRKVALAMEVVVGKAYGHQTPVFGDEMKYLVFRPYWEVTPSIQRAEIVPAIERDRNYLAKKGFVVVEYSGDVVADGTVSDDVLRRLRAGELEVWQKPGPENSLGLVKFIFPNHYNVYLHSTSAKELFSQARRDFSHGCIRVGKPAELAAWVLRKNASWDPERVQAAMQTGKDNQRVNLAVPIPVLIVYATARVGEGGEVYFFDDIYGLDRDLDAVLARGYPFPS